MEAQGVAVWRLYIGDGMWRGSCSAEARYCERTGRRTETESGGPGGTSPQHRIKSSIHYRPGRPDVSFVSVLTSRIAGYVIRASGGVGGALSDGCPYPYILKFIQSSCSFNSFETIKVSFLLRFP